ncbi:fimbrial protein [Pseudomonas sp. PDM19]|uniref:fimbrial protein n=1 Tax=Pseudomonas sp. PDM19 TaxID=2769272 RepID=UPI001CE0F3A8|nr:fimbrial protein [Pseudomonas sp. PDM19]
MYKMGLKVSTVCVAFLAILAGTAMADCKIVDGYSPMVRTQPLLGGSLTVGRDIPVGAEIYRQTFNPVGNIMLNCSAGIYTIQQDASLPITPLPNSGWSGGLYGNKVYQTGVPGIGVAILTLGQPLPASTPMTNCSATGACNYIYSWHMGFDLSFVKTGDVSPGVIQGSQLPTMARSLISSNTVEYQRVNFSGSINIVSRTCQTPDVTVQMGSHKTDEFSGRNSSTPWTDFSISLNNCPAFNGYYQGTGPKWSSDGTIANLNSRKNNVIQVSIWPTIMPLDPGLSILDLDPSPAGMPPAATGVGVQIADQTGTPWPLIAFRESGITPSSVEGASYTIPLKARYVQTGDTISAGPANATATFTLNYE